MEDKGEGAEVGRRRSECRSFICEGRKDRKDSVESLKLRDSFQRSLSQADGLGQGAARVSKQKLQLEASCVG